MNDRSVLLWVVTLLVIGTFAAVAVITPGMVNPSDSSPGNENQDQVREGLDFGIPAFSRPLETSDEDVGTTLEIIAPPEHDFLEGGGRWVWVFSIIGNGITPADLTMTYPAGEAMKYVSWMSVPGSGVVTGYGPLITQGPGVTMTAAATEVNLTVYKPGDYTLRVWIMDQEATAVEGIPSVFSPHTRSPELLSAVKVEEYVPPPPPEPESAVNVTLSLSSSASEVRVGQRSRFTVSEEVSRSSTDWKGTVNDMIIVEKEGIGLGDVEGRVASTLGFSDIEWIDGGDHLIGRLKSTTPYGSLSFLDRTRWTTTFELTFDTPGSYRVVLWAEDGGNGAVVSNEATMVISVIGDEEEEEAPEPTPVPPPEASPGPAAEQDGSPPVETTPDGPPPLEPSPVDEGAPDPSEVEGPESDDEGGGEDGEGGGDDEREETEELED